MPEEDFQDFEAGERVAGEERSSWRREEVKGRNDPTSCERKGSWSRKVGGERRREAFGEEGSGGESCVGGKYGSVGGRHWSVEGKFESVGGRIGSVGGKYGSVGGRLQRKGEEGNSLSRSASLPPATRERSRVKRVSGQSQMLFTDGKISNNIRLRA